jgi:hypothetical protein
MIVAHAAIDAAAHLTRLMVLLPPYGWSVPGPAPPGLQGVSITPR